jgi:ring-1,2-phenylacetyl-CoA epoxidase subunit PaaD
MVSATLATEDAALRARVLQVLETVCDPEIPVLTIADLGVLRDVVVHGDDIEVVITPTYSGCPATEVIRADVLAALAAAGMARARVRSVLAPPWTTDWISPAGRRKLREYGIAPPERGAAVRCPQCGSAETVVLSQFGSTPCKALWRCMACREPFDYFKCH